MIKLSFTLTNPWSDRFDAGWMRGGHLYGNKAWEFQAYRSNTIAEACLELTHRQDHAGLRLEFGIFTFSFTFNIYDTRHWNYADRRWEVYNDEENILR